MSKKIKKIKCKICNARYEVKDESEWKKNKMECPHCKSFYSPLPITEGLLQDTQEKYLKNRDDKYLSLLYEYSYSYSHSLILKYYSNKLKTTELIDYHAHNSATYFIENYLYREDFKIEVSFGSYILTKILYSIFGKHERESAELSINFLSDDGKEIIVPVDNSLDKVEESIHKEDVLNYFMNLVGSVKNYCTIRENLLMLLALRIYLHRGEKSVDKFFRVYSREGKPVFLKTIEMLYSELKNKPTNL